jgi:hypothetical protein
MRLTVIFAALALVHAPALAPAAGAQPAPQASAPALQTYTTDDTPIGVLLDDPASRAVLDRHVPNFSAGPQLAMIRGATLRQIQGYALKVLSDPVLAAIDADLAKLPPKPVTVVSRMTTDEAKVRPYVLPDPLTLSNGEPVHDAATWRLKRRPQIMTMFETLEYGRAPGRPMDERFDVFDKGTPAFQGAAIRKQVVIRLAKDPSTPSIQLVEYVPAGAKKPVPVFLMIGFTAPSAMFDDPGIRPGLVWDPATKRRVPAPGDVAYRFNDAKKFLDAGFAVAAFYYGDVDPDFPGGYPLGIRATYDKVDEIHRAPDAWGAISAWAWGLSRVQDYLETDKALDARRVAIYGASRLGKTALWAAASDQRFAAVVACCSGKMGAGLMRRNFGASIRGDDGGADYWVAANFKRFYDHEEALPMDGHMLLALIAPRPVMLQTGAHDHAADPKGEFLAEVAAGPVYRLLGAQDLGTTAWPAQAPILNDLGYTMNSGGHGPAPADWDIYLAFLKLHLEPGR